VTVCFAVLLATAIALLVVVRRWSRPRATNAPPAVPIPAVLRDTYDERLDDDLRALE
jgi:hypothetical protein